LREVTGAVVANLQADIGGLEFSAGLNVLVFKVFNLAGRWRGHSLH
jgi:hypothetical protein